MNIKRAFLTAAAVLMVPGFALAQDASFPVSVEFFPSGDEDVTATISCNTGVPLTQDATISADDGVEFVVTNVVGGDCDITMDGLAAGWEATDNGNCSFTGVTEGQQAECVFYAEPVNLTFTANLVWTASTEDGIDDVDPYGYVNIGCNNVYTYGMTNTLNTVTLYNVWVDPAYDEVVLDAQTYGADPAGSSSCWASLSVQDSAVEVDNTGCNSFDVDAGDTEASCTITASVFFEGIPTLSQYGMAIMVLLMLGVGFVGFRRFV